MYVRKKNAQMGCTACQQSVGATTGASMLGFVIGFGALLWLITRGGRKA